MHDLSNGIPSLINDIFVKTTRDENQTILSIRTKEEKTCTFKSVRKSVLSACKKSWKEIERHSVAYWLDIKLSKDDTTDILNRYFNGMGLAGMLEAKGYGQLDLLSSFIVKI